MCLAGVEERPLLGWGQGNFGYVFARHFQPSLYNVEPWYDRAHNIVLDWLIAGGILGALAYFSIFLVAFYYLGWRGLVKRDTVFTITETAVLIGLLSGYLVHNLVVFADPMSYLFFAITLAYIHAKVATPIKVATGVKIARSLTTPAVQYVALGVALLILASAICFVHLPTMKAVSLAPTMNAANTPTELINTTKTVLANNSFCLLYTSPSPRDRTRSRMPSSA